MDNRNPGDASNEQAPPVNNGGGGGSRFARIAIIIVALLLLLLAIPFACQAFRGNSDNGGSGGGSGNASQEEQGSGGGAGGENTSSAGGSGDGSGSETTMQADTDSGENTGAENTNGSASGGGREAATAQLASIPAGQLSGSGGGGSSITVPSAEISGSGGWVSVRQESAGGEPGEVLGYAPLEQGENENVNVPLQAPLSGSGELLVSVHEDAPADGSFTFPDGDPTVESSSGETASETVAYSFSDGVQEDALPNSGGPLLPALGAALLALGVALRTALGPQK